MAPGDLQDFISLLQGAFGKVFTPSDPAILVTSSVARPHVCGVVERFYPTAAVLSQNEIHSKVKIRSLGQLS